MCSRQQQSDHIYRATAALQQCESIAFMCQSCSAHQGVSAYQLVLTVEQWEAQGLVLTLQRGELVPEKDVST